MTDARGPTPAPAGVDAERERQRAREQEDRQGVAGEDVARELPARHAVGLRGWVARRRAATDDRDAGPERGPERIEDQARLHAADRRHDDAEPWREPRLCGGLRDGLVGGGDVIGREVAAQPGHDVDRIRREQGERHGVLAEAQDRGHLARAARSGELDPGVTGSHLVDHELVVDLPGAHQERGLRCRAGETGVALREDPIQCAREVDVVAVTDGHPEHGRTIRFGPPSPGPESDRAPRVRPDQPKVKQYASAPARGTRSRTCGPRSGPPAG